MILVAAPANDSAPPPEVHRRQTSDCWLPSEGDTALLLVLGDMMPVLINIGSTAPIFIPSAKSRSRTKWWSSAESRPTLYEPPSIHPVFKRRKITNLPAMLSSAAVASLGLLSAPSIGTERSNTHVTGLTWSVAHCWPRFPTPCFQPQL